MAAPGVVVGELMCRFLRQDWPLSATLETELGGKHILTANLKASEDSFDQQEQSFLLF